MSMNAPPKALPITSMRPKPAPELADQPFQFQVQSAGMLATALPSRASVPNS
jgi:hypothetical protein